MVKTLIVTTKKKREFQDITKQVEEILIKEGVKTGLCNIFLPHTSASVILNEFEEGSEYNFNEVFNKIVPEVKWDHHHDPDHTPDHILSSLFGQSVTIPMTNGRLDLGTWQKVIFVDFNGPRERQILISIIQ